MKKIKLLLAIGLMIGTTNVNAQTKKLTMKEKIAAKMAAVDAKLAEAAGGSSGDSGLGKGKPKYVTYDFKDDIGLSGTYFTSEVQYKNYQTVGFEFIKEDGGELVNRVNIYCAEVNNTEAKLVWKLHEKWQRKFGVVLCYSGDKDLIQIADGVLAFTDNGTIVTAVFAKDSTQLAEYDLETAQVLYDQKEGIINAAAIAKEDARWMKSDLYAKNIEKIVFAPEDWQLMKRGEPNNPPKVDGKAWTTELDMGGNMNYMAFFKMPPKDKYPGQDINIVYEMNGKTTNRVDQRNVSPPWAKMISKISSSDFDDRQHAPKCLRTYNQYAGRWVQDYAFIQCLYLNKDKFKIGSKYNLTVKMYANRDGENGELIAEGTVTLKYTAKAHEMFTGDPTTSVWATFEDFLEE
jgi:hypothetical protein